VAPFEFPNKKEGNIPDLEEIDLPFGLVDLKQTGRGDNLGAPILRSATSGGGGNNKDEEEYFTLAQFSVPLVVQSIHALAIACASFA
jgi:hypothetical protein